MSATVPPTAATVTTVDAASVPAAVAVYVAVPATAATTDIAAVPSAAVVPVSVVAGVPPAVAADFLLLLLLLLYI